MYTALQSNKAINFGVVSVVSGLIPILYEILQYDNVGDSGKGGALSLLVFIIIIQGTLASSEKLKRELVEKMSFILIGEVIVAMLIADLNDLQPDIRPRPKRSSGHNGSRNMYSPYLSLFGLLCFWRISLQLKRTEFLQCQSDLPFALWTLNGDQAILPWCVALVMICLHDVLRRSHS